MRKLILTFAIAYAAPLAAQFTVFTVSGTAASGNTFSGYVAYVDLTNGSIAPVATAALAPGTGCMTQGQAVQLTDTIMFAAGAGTLLAVDANLGPGLSNQLYAARPCGTPLGLLKNAGQFVTPIEPVVQGIGIIGGPSLWFPSAGGAVIGNPTIRQAMDARVAVSGWIGCGSTTGTLLVSNGRNTGSTAQPVPGSLAPRMGVGLTQSRSLLIVAMINGDESALVGLTLPDFAGVLMALGAWDAVNLDGGGSSTFAWTPGSAHVTPVANLPHISSASIAVKPAPSPCYSYPYAKVTGPAPCLASPGTGYRPIYANFGFVAAPAAR